MVRVPTWRVSKKISRCADVRTVERGVDESEETGPPRRALLEDEDSFSMKDYVASKGRGRRGDTRRSTGTRSVSW